MKAVFYKSGSGLVIGRLLEYDLDVTAESLGEAVRRLQVAMAGHAVNRHASGAEYVWDDKPAPKEFFDKWSEGFAVFYTREFFAFDGKPVEIPSLLIRVWEKNS